MTGNETILKAINEGDIAKAKKYLEDNVREETAKKSGARTSDVTIIKGIMKDLLKTTNRTEPGYFTIDFDGEDYFGFTDCHRIVASKMDFGYKELENPYKLDEMFKSISFGKYNNAECIEINHGDAKLFSKMQKSKGRNERKSPYILETEFGYIGMNPDYLLNMLDFIGTDKIFFWDKKESYTGDFKYFTAPLFAINEEDKRFGLILPVAIHNSDDGINALKENGFNVEVSGKGMNVEITIKKEA